MSSLAVENLFSVKGKVALVTGGSRGVGKMVYISSRTAKECEETAKELNALGPGRCIALPADLQNYEEVENLVQQLTSRESSLHILVNNAGAAWVTAHTFAAAGGSLLASTPAQRFGKPEDVAGAALYLASPAGAWVNGATVRLDGGLLLTGKELKRQALKQLSRSKL
ncbi:hypothetical protein H0H87_009211 [Tephrocybe sp. NHM501043]|nr:hypothetical protein H0H87_009211 [Tephrocybe sp. NHM501043]